MNWWSWDWHCPAGKYTQTTSTPQTHRTFNVIVVYSLQSEIFRFLAIQSFAIAKARQTIFRESYEKSTIIVCSTHNLWSEATNPLQPIIQLTHVQRILQYTSEIHYAQLQKTSIISALIRAYDQQCFCGEQKKSQPKKNRHQFSERFHLDWIQSVHWGRDWRSACFLTTF